MLQELEDINEVNCLVNGLEHSLEYTHSDSGASYWECLFCPFTTSEVEDCQL